jgi:tetratricopeptide (TPR) repeat protein
MRVRFVLAAVMGMVALSAAALARAETAAEWFAKGEALLAKGEFAAALQPFTAAARNDRSNPEYMQHYAMVRRVVDLREQLANEKNAQQWEYVARALHAFYVSERIYPEILKIDEQLHSRLSSAETAAMLADTQLAMSLDGQAVETLSSVKPAKATPMTQSLLGISLARTGKGDQAKQIAQNLSLSSGAGPNLLYAAARLHAATGDSAKSVALLTACFEATLPSVSDGFKSHAKECPEFAALATTPEFARALETKSKLTESKCSGGSSCAGCPMAGKCPRSQGKH